MTDNSLDVQLADALAMPDGEVMQAADLLTLVHARRQLDPGTTAFAKASPAARQDHALRENASGSAGGAGAYETRREDAPRGERGRLLPSVGVGVGVAVLVAAVVGGSMLVFRHNGSPTVGPPSAAHHVQATPVPSPSGKTVTRKVVYTLPAGENQPFSLGADPKRRGVWFVTGTDAVTSIVFVSVDPSQDRVFSVHAYYPLGAAGGIAVASDGTVWAGVNMVLIHLDPTTGAVTTYRVPTPGDSAAAESYNPPFVKGTHYISAVAVTGTDTVALAIADADQVVVFRDGRFLDWSLPTNTVPQGVAYLDDGTLGVSLSDYNTHYTDRVVTFTPTGRRSESQLVDVWNLVSTGTQFVTVANGVLIFNAHAQLTATVPFVPTTNPPDSISGFELGILPDGDLVTGSRDGVLVANLSSGTTIDLRLPSVACPNPDSISYPVGVSPPTPYPAGYLCAQTPQLLASDGAGDVWMVLGNQSEIDVLESLRAQ